MRKLVLAGLLAGAVVAALPGRSEAHGRSPYNQHGYNWLGSFAFRRMAWIHMDGPLYSYGPYNTPGYLVMHVPQPYHGTYSPADPNLWNMGYGARGPNVPAPAAGYPPGGAPTGGPTQPYRYVGSAPRAEPPNYGLPRVLPVAYDAVYPEWMTGGSR